MSVAIRVGTDIVAVHRLQDLVDSASPLLDRVFTASERADTADVAQRLAGRWAAKESALKALGAGVDQIALRDVEVVRQASGAPQLRLHGAAATAARGLELSSWSVSISHDGDYATAVVCASGG